MVAGYLTDLCTMVWSAFRSYRFMHCATVR